MNIGGWLFLIFGWGVVIFLVFYCMKKVFEKEAKFK